MRRYILALSFLLVSVYAWAVSEYGSNKTVYPSRYFVTSGSVQVREQPSMTAKVVMRLEGGDILYVDDGSIYESDGGTRWISISGNNGYVPIGRLTIEANPYYERPPTFDPWPLMPVWLKITLAVVFALFIAFYVWLAIRKGWFKPFAGVKVRGMRKILFYNKEPYWDCLFSALLVLAAFVSTFVLFTVAGGVFLGGGWVVRVLSRVVFWALITAGFGGAAFAIGYALWGDMDGCWGKILLLVLAVVLYYLGDAAIGWKQGIYGFGDNALTWGDSVFKSFSIFHITWGIIKVCWKYALFIMLLPVVSLGVCGALFMLFNWSLILQEKAVLKRYNVENPCPICGHPSEPAVYRSHGLPLPVPLMPGRWGVYYIEHPSTGEMMPTRFREGKDYLERECAHCHNIIAAQMGVEKHIAFAGVPGSGKTTMMYRLLSQLLDRRIGLEAVASLTDDNSLEDRQFKRTYEQIEGGKRMTASDFPDQTRRGRRKAIQLLVNNPRRVLPYRLFFNDLAGEMFSVDKNRVEDAPFLRNTQLVLFTLDPLTMNLMNLSLSPGMQEWFAGRGITPASTGRKYSIQDAVDRLLNMILNYRGGDGSREIHLIVNLAKSDEGYLGQRSRTSDSLKDFVRNELGMENIVYMLDNTFKSVAYYAVSAAEASSQSRVDLLLDDIFNKLDISFKEFTEEDLRRNREEAARIMEERQKEHDRTIGGTGLGRSPVARVATMAFLAALFIGGGYLIWDSRTKAANYEEAMEQAESLFENLCYDDAIESIDKSMREKRLGTRYNDQLLSLKEEILTARKARIEELVSVLKANIDHQPGRQSNLEVSARYRALDNLREFQSKEEELEALDPGNEILVLFHSEFSRLLAKYHIVL